MATDDKKKKKKNAKRAQGTEKGTGLQTGQTTAPKQKATTTIPTKTIEPVQKRAMTGKGLTTGTPASTPTPPQGRGGLDTGEKDTGVMDTITGGLKTGGRFLGDVMGGVADAVTAPFEGLAGDIGTSYEEFVQTLDPVQRQAMTESILTTGLSMLASSDQPRATPPSFLGEVGRAGLAGVERFGQRETQLRAQELQQQQFAEQQAQSLRKYQIDLLKAMETGEETEFNFVGVGDAADKLAITQLGYGPNEWNKDLSPAQRSEILNSNEFQEKAKNNRKIESMGRALGTGTGKRLIDETQTVGQFESEARGRFIYEVLPGGIVKKADPNITMAEVNSDPNKRILEPLPASTFNNLLETYHLAGDMKDVLYTEDGAVIDEEKKKALEKFTGPIDNIIAPWRRMFNLAGEEEMNIWQALSLVRDRFARGQTGAQAALTELKELRGMIVDFGLGDEEVVHMVTGAIKNLENRIRKTNETVLNQNYIPLNVQRGDEKVGMVIRRKGDDEAKLLINPMSKMYDVYNQEKEKDNLVNARFISYEEAQEAVRTGKLPGF